MIVQENSSTFLPCGQELKEPHSIKSLDFFTMIKRRESNGTLVIVDPKTRNVYFKKKTMQTSFHWTYQFM